jgi:hypothetical protein
VWCHLSITESIAISVAPASSSDTLTSISSAYVHRSMDMAGGHRLARSVQCRQVEAAIFQYINGFYNAPRRHSYLGGISPLAFEA